METTNTAAATELQTALSSKYGGLSWDGKVLTLEQDAYADGTYAEPIYRATAKDAAGNRYMIKWAVKDGFDGEDEGEACDWDSPESVTLIESAA